jgi:hypothetical protein
MILGVVAMRAAVETPGVSVPGPDISYGGCVVRRLRRRMKKNSRARMRRRPTTAMGMAMASLFLIELPPPE